MSMPEIPLVSIIMNCYNGEKYLREALESVLAQTYQSWELIFWDNQSKDQSMKIFNSYDDERLKYFYASKHTRLYEARNYAIQKASGEFIAFLDVDDWWIPEKLKKQIPLFEDSGVGLVYGNYWFENGRKETRKIIYKKQLPSGRILNDLLKHYVVGLLTIVIRRQAFENLAFPFNSKYHIIGDFDLVIRIALSWKIESIQEPCAHYRWHENNESHKTQQLNIKEHEAWYAEMRKHSIISCMDGFNKQAIQINYLKAVISINNQNYLAAIKTFFRLPMSMEKIKLLISILLPKFLLNFLRN